MIANFASVRKIPQPSHDIDDFAGVRIKPQHSHDIDDFAGVRLRPASIEEDSWAPLIGKSALKGITSIADIPQVIGSIAEQSLNPEYSLPGQVRKIYHQATGKPHEELNGPSNYISSLPLASQKIKEGLEYYTGTDLEPNAGDNSMKRIAQHATEFGSSTLIPGGLFTKGAGLANKAKEAAKFAKTGAQIGAISGVAQELGVNPVVADLGSSIAHPQDLMSLMKGARTVGGKGVRKIMGLSPKGLNIEAAQAARDLGVDLPAAALTDSKLTALADQVINKAPLFGNMMSKKYATTEEQTRKALTKILDRVGPYENENIIAQKSNKYKARDNLLSENSTFVPFKTIKATKEIEFKNPLKTPEQKQALQSAKELEEGLLLNGVPKEMSIEALLEQKVALNELIWKNPKSVRDKLIPIRNGLLEDIEDYGKINPEWYKTFKEADKLYGDVEKRKTLEKLLEHKSINHAVDELSFNKLANNIYNPQNLKDIKELVDPETFEQIKGLGKIAQAMAKRNKNIPNPSGTVPTALNATAIGGLLTGMIFRPINTIYTVTGYGIGGYVLTKLLTNKKFIDSAVKYAENPNIPNTMALNKLIKDRTGYSAIALQRELERENAQQNEEQ
jgi:hypothetical protein